MGVVTGVRPTSSAIFNDDCSSALEKRVLVARNNVRQRNVRFDELANQIHENRHWSKEDCCQHWYNAEDYRNFKLSSLSPRSNTGCGKHNNKMSCIGILDSVYKLCCSEPHEKEEEEDHDTATASDVTNNNKKNLGCNVKIEEVRLRQMCLTEVGLYQLGLERTKFIAKDCRRRRKDLSYIISLYWLDEDEMRKRCELISGVSRLFAHRVALAQQLATTT